MIPSLLVKQPRRLCVNMSYFDGLVQERHNSSTLAKELNFSCISPSIYPPRTGHLIKTKQSTKKIVGISYIHILYVATDTSVSILCPSVQQATPLSPSTEAIGMLTGDNEGINSTNSQGGGWQYSSSTRENSVNTMAADALAPCVTRYSASIF